MTRHYVTRVPMTIWALLAFLVAASGVSMITEASSPQIEERRTVVRESPLVEVAFVVDTTGSMGGLIEGAKKKIWTIANEILDGKPTPDVRFALVAFRDKGDAYVTRVFDLTDNIDEVYENLMSFGADGGGDTPEHVSQALHDAITKLQWSTSDRALKLIYLVGDSPPHTDYNDGLDYKSEVRTAVDKDIIVNTVQCGTNPTTTPVWKEIALLGEGRFAAIEQSGGMVVRDTPMDAELARLNRQLEQTVIAYGAESKRAEMARRSTLAMDMAAPAAAERASYKARSGYVEEADLVDAYSSGRVDLGKLDDKQLPAELKELSDGQLQKLLEDKRQEREQIKKRIAEVSRKREEFLLEEDKKAGGARDGFDEVVFETLKQHAAKKGISY